MNTNVKIETLVTARALLTNTPL